MSEGGPEGNGAPAPPAGPAGPPELVPSPELRERMLWIFGVSYLALFLLAVLWNQRWLREPRSFLRLADERTARVATATLGWAGLGAAAGLAVVGTLRLGRRLACLRIMEEEFARLLGAVDARQAFYIALFSAVAEEALFRGAMLNAWGLHVSSLVFGSLHVLNRRIWHWSLLALGLGYLLGGLYRLSGDLAAPIACHFAINFINLQLIGRRARELGLR